jgi:hypothetical protein
MAGGVRCSITRGMAASPEHVFAMKAFAARSRDEEDLRRLADIIASAPWPTRSMCVLASSRLSRCRTGPKGVLDDLFLQ